MIIGIQALSHNNVQLLNKAFWMTTCRTYLFLETKSELESESGIEIEIEMR